MSFLSIVLSVFRRCTTFDYSLNAFKNGDDQQNENPPLTSNY